MRVWPLSMACFNRSVTQSTPVSMARGKLVDPDTLWGPATINRFGKPLVRTPR